MHQHNPARKYTATDQQNKEMSDVTSASKRQIM